jgi:hypothetical protein
LRAGLIAFSCTQCELAPYTKDSLGCENTTQTPAAWLDEDEEWHNCPIKFVSQSVIDFMEKYDSYKNKMATPPDFENQSAKFNSAVRIFESYLSKYNEMKQGK